MSQPASLLFWTLLLSGHSSWREEYRQFLVTQCERTWHLRLSPLSIEYYMEDERAPVTENLLLLKIAMSPLCHTMTLCSQVLSLTAPLPCPF
jgi:hypothetical protein